MGLSSNAASTPASILKIEMVARPSPHALLSGRQIAETSMDMVARALSVGQSHRAIPITVALAKAVAARVQGSIVQSVLGKHDIMNSNAITWATQVERCS